MPSRTKIGNGFVLNWYLWKTNYFKHNVRITFKETVWWTYLCGIFGSCTLLNELSKLRAAIRRIVVLHTLILESTPPPLHTYAHFPSNNEDFSYWEKTKISKNWAWMTRSSQIFSIFSNRRYNPAILFVICI